MSHLVEATRQMALVARAGHPLGEALRASAGQSRWLARVADQIEAGDTVAQAMRRHPRVFSPFYTSMVEAAEASENPADLLGQLSRWLERADSARRSLRTALFYPLLVANILLVEMLVFAWWVLPGAIVPLAATQGLALPPHLGDLLGLAALAALVVLDATALASRASAGLVARLPGLGSLRLWAEQALWARAAGSLLGAGVELPRALDLATQVVEVPSLQSHLQSASEEVRKGASLSQVLAEIPGLEPCLTWAAASGETREDLAPLLLDAADRLDAQIERRLEHYVRVAEPWAMACAGLLVLVGLVSFWAPFYHLVGRASS